MSQIESSFSQFVQSESICPETGKRTLKQETVQYAGGLWNNEEKLRYVAFVLFNKNALSSKLQRRASKVFKQMSHFIGTRNPSQCRSQNQKMYKRFKTVNRIVSEFKKEIGENNFMEAFNNLSLESTIKFVTEMELKPFSQKEQTKQPQKVLICTSMQTEETGIQIKSDQQEWMFSMFKAWMLSKVIVPTFPPWNQVFTY